MNRTYTLLYILLTISLIATSNSCTKDIVDEFTPIQERWASLNDFTSSTNEEKTVAIEAAEDEFVVETPNAIIHFPKESIRDAITDDVVVGPIQMIYEELTSYKGLFLNSLDSETLGGETIYSRYTINYQLKQGNKTLVLNDLVPAFIYLKEEDNVIDEQRVFYWETDTDEDGWFLNTNIDVFADEWNFTVDGTNYAGKGYKMLLRGTGMFTLAEHEHLLYINTEEYGNVDISIEDKFKNSNTKIYVARSGHFSLIPLDLINSKYTHSQIRKDEEIIIFGMTVVDEKIYFGRKDIIVGSTNEYSLAFNEVSYVEAIEELQRM